MTLAGRNNILDAKSISFALLAIWCYAFWPTIAAAGKSYLKSGYDYQGFVVLPVVGILIALNSKSLKRANINYSPFGLLLLAVSTLIWLLAKLIEINLAQQTAIIAMPLAIVWMNFGKKITTILFLPLACLFLLLPVGQSLHSLIQDGFAWTLMQALYISGQGVYWDAHHIIINNHAYDIHAYLSSLRHVLLFASFGAVYAAFRTKQIIAAICIQLSFIFMPICMLFICLYSYIMMNLLFNNEQFIVNNMALCGVALTIIGLAHAMVLGYFMRDRKDIILTTDNIDWHDMQFRKNSIIKPLTIGATILLCTPLVAKHIIQSQNYNTKQLLNIPSKINGWNTQTIAANNNGIDAKFKRAKTTVNLSIAHDAKPLHTNWKELKQSCKTIKIEEKTIPVHETILHNDKNKYKVLWEVNYVNGHYTNNATVAKALMHMYNLASHGSKSGIIRLSTDADTEINYARDNLKNFMQDFTHAALG